jgi:hypothetical protein
MAEEKHLEPHKEIGLATVSRPAQSLQRAAGARHIGSQNMRAIPDAITSGMRVRITSQADVLAERRSPTLGRRFFMCRPSSPCLPIMWQRSQFERRFFWLNP